MQASLRTRTRCSPATRTSFAVRPTNLVVARPIPLLTRSRPETTAKSSPARGRSRADTASTVASRWCEQSHTPLAPRRTRPRNTVSLRSNATATVRRQQTAQPPPPQCQLSSPVAPTPRPRPPTRTTPETESAATHTRYRRTEAPRPVRALRTAAGRLAHGPAGRASPETSGSAR